SQNFVSNAKRHNDPKLSDRGVRRGTCMVGGKAAVEAGAVTHGAVRCRLLSRGLIEDDATHYGALPRRKQKRATLAAILNEYVRVYFPEYAKFHSGAGVVGVPGFWQEPLLTNRREVRCHATR
ncbi:MAG TPA: hypothetical protein VGQ41_18810, partial [Pyrinomonadaceae bacterium]|nr:hypothetical protein [Pyrinomonadaceae bacterium]